MSVLYHNPRCSKSRAALALLEERGVQFSVVRYLETPLDADALVDLLAKLGMVPRELIRAGEAVYKALELDKEGVTDEQMIEAMAVNPILMQRPVFVHSGRAVVGRPPERVLELLD